MRTLVIGGNGYIASRVIPQLLDAGDEVLAGVRSPDKLDSFWWREQVSAIPLDVLDGESVRTAFAELPEKVVYLVHGMAADGFADADRQAAEHVRKAVKDSSVKQMVYLSGIIPKIPREDLSAHLSSRLEVEEILSESSVPVITLRAAMIVGAGSTSFELMRQLAQRLPVTVLPEWMNSLVEPLAVSDLAGAVHGALSYAGPTRHFDVGGGEQISYPDLISETLELLQSDRPAFKLPFVPEFVVSKIAGMISDVPAETTSALIESLHEDMIASSREWVAELMPIGFETTDLRVAIQRAIAKPNHLLRPSERDPVGVLPGDRASFPVADDAN